MSRPIKVEYYLGTDVYGRRSNLKGVLQTGGGYCWSIASDPVSQRDEGERIASLTTAQLAEIAAVVAAHRGSQT
jgi:hypothetical protein